MTTQGAKSKVRGVSRDPVRDGLVLAAMAIVVLALSIGINLQFGLTFWLTALTASSIYLALVSSHVLIRRSDHVAVLRREVARLEGQLAQGSNHAMSVPPTLDGRSDPMSAPAPAPAPTTETAAAIPSTVTTAKSIETISLEDYWTFRPTSHDVPMQSEVSALDESLQPNHHALEQANTPDWSGIESAAWATVPSSTGCIISAIPTAVPVAHPNATSAVLTQTVPQADAAAFDDQPVNFPPKAVELVVLPATSDIEKINVIIKKLAADINAGHGHLQVANLPDAVVMPPHQAHLTRGDAADVEASIDALHAVAGVMRDASQGRAAADYHLADTAAPPPLVVRRSVAPPPLPVPDRDPRLAMIADALRRERVDVMLEPILGLGDRRAQHFEVTVRLNVNGDACDIDIPGVRGAGLLPLFDAIKVERSARISWRMEDRGKTGSLFSGMSGESLVNDRFLNRFADTYRQGETLSSRLVLSFTQRDLRTFSELHWATIGDMKELGFRFCLEDVTDLDLDFETLADKGFSFVKLDAPVFLEGLQVANGAAANALIPPADICRHFSELRLTIIVGAITDEQQSADVAACGAVLGQGALFGGPRPVKADVLRTPNAAHAASAVA